MGYVQLMCMEPTYLKLKHGAKNSNLDVDKKYFSASYNGTLGNFIVNYNLPKLTEDEEIDTDEYSVLCVVQNILQRGKKTFPSEYLKEKIKDLKEYDIVMRFQMALLNLFRESYVSLKKTKLKLYIAESDYVGTEKLITIAYEDVYKWITAIVDLSKVPLKLPELIILSEPSSDAININFKISSGFNNDEMEDGAGIYIYADYESESDYYRIATSTHIKYRFDAETYDKENEALLFLLRNIFGHNEFREGQLPIIKNALAFEDTIGILPTGTGKSLCYQMAVLLQPGVSLITVPIISLMQDQIRGMNNRGIDRVGSISSVVTGNARDYIMDQFLDGKYQCILVSPERLQNEKFVRKLQKLNQEMNFSYAVIDEVHCLSEWGHDFRVSYLRLIPNLKKYCTDICLLGLTATASQQVLEDLKAEFDNDGSGIKTLTSMDRDELEFKRIHIKYPSERFKIIEDIIEEHNKTYESNGVQKPSVGLVFCATVSPGGSFSKPAVKNIYKKLNETDRLNGRVLEYYAKNSKPEERSSIQSKFMDKKFDGIMVCTNAFGMGIDKENIKFTVHSSIPASVESFFQEAGRAGRDADKSIKSTCYIVCRLEDQEQFVEQIFNPETSQTSREILSDQLYGDLATTMHFYNSGRPSFDTVYSDMKLFINNLPEEYNFSSDVELENYQNTLYRLFLLGIVDNWTINYISPYSGTLKIEYADANRLKIKENLLKYIHKHDKEFCIDGSNPNYDKYWKIVREAEENGRDANIREYANILYLWTEDNILYTRLQSIKTMYDLCATKITDEEFREKLNDYFRFSDKSLIFGMIASEPMNYHLWFNVLYEKKDNGDISPIGKEEAVTRNNMLARQLESYWRNTGLNYLSGMLRLIISKFEGTEGEWRLRDSFKTIRQSVDIDESEILDKTLAIAKKCREQNALSRVLIEFNSEYADKIYNSLHDQYSSAYLINKATKKINSILEDELKWII